MAKKGQGAGIRFLREHVDHEGEDCLPWPLTRDERGYGMLAHNGQSWRAHRFMCVLAHGEPSTPQHQAAHSCGNGHLGCVNPRHLSWKTPEENQEDTRRLGRIQFKGRPRRKLSQQQVEELRASTLSRKELAEKYGIRLESVDRIRSGRARTRTDYIYNRRFAPDVRAAMVERTKQMRASGATHREIAEHLNVTTATVSNFLTGR